MAMNQHKCDCMCMLHVVYTCSVSQGGLFDPLFHVFSFLGLALHDTAVILVMYLLLTLMSKQDKP